MSRDPRVGYARPLREADMSQVHKARRRSLPTQTAHAGVGPSPKPASAVELAPAAVAGGDMSRFRWWRRRRGGHWERWYVAPGMLQIWIPVRRCSHETGVRPWAGCLGMPECETW